MKVEKESESRWFTWHPHVASININSPLETFNQKKELQSFKSHLEVLLLKESKEQINQLIRLVYIVEWITKQL